MGVACGILSVFIIGVLINLWGVPRLIRFAERLIDRIPLVKTIYGAVRDLLGFFSRSDDLGTRKMVMMSVGDTGMRTPGLVTRDHLDDLPSGLGGEGVVAVYIPFRQPPPPPARTTRQKTRGCRPLRRRPATLDISPPWPLRTRRVRASVQFDRARAHRGVTKHPDSAVCPPFGVRSLSAPSFPSVLV
jgi:hypothetical protein